jgi:FKBP-type peptidyl-prolyl cis-trans isomerase FklB
MPAAPKLSPAEQKQHMSYAIGMNIGNSMKRGGVELDVEAMAGAIKDVLAGSALKLTDQQAQDAMKSYQMEARSKHEEMQKQAAEKNKKDGEAFLAENKKKPGVKTHPVTLAEGTTAELQYKVITEGTGAMPKSNDTVTVNYRGTLVNGKEFDSSAKRGQPAKFQVTRVVRGWTEALQMMKAGSKWELYLPSVLAYGDGGGPGIEPGSTLIFEVELLGNEAPQPPPPPQPLTSDIIRVPSAEELKKGAKIEVIKAEDLEKFTNSAAKKPVK